MGSDFVGPHEPLGRPKSTLSVRQKALEGLQQWSGVLSLTALTVHSDGLQKADPRKVRAEEGRVVRETESGSCMG